MPRIAKKKAPDLRSGAQILFNQVFKKRQANDRSLALSSPLQAQAQAADEHFVRGVQA